ncbi:hypothetical protein ACH4Q6_11755 [Streptomyces lydicus]|uniref:hypothetical protein n=1 Tax=Streptomyces lydicus TaxID=47763 RepID=UPI0037B5694E
MPTSTPQPHTETAVDLPRPAKPDYSNVFLEPVYANGFLEAELEDDSSAPAAFRAAY